MAVRTGRWSRLRLEAREVFSYLQRAQQTVTGSTPRVTSVGSHAFVLDAGVELAFVARHERRY